MKALLALAVLFTGSAAVAAPADAESPSSSEASRICVLFQQERGPSRRICLTASEWQARFGPDWRQHLSGRNVEDDLALLGTLTRPRSEPVLRDDCMRCIRVDPPRLD